MLGQIPTPRTVSEVEEVRLESDKKVGRIEEEIQNLCDRLDKMEKENAYLRSLVEKLAS